MSTRAPARNTFLGLCVLAASTAGTADARAETEPFLSELMLSGTTFCPKGFARADGQLLPINQNQALFSLLGTMYGGNGQTTFALPDLRGRVPIGDGAAAGLSNYQLGQIGGSESLTLTAANLPAHNHPVNATSAAADRPGPANKFLANDANDFNKYSFGPPDVVMAPGMISAAGGSQPVSHRSPYLAMTWCIAVQGIFPSRN